MNERPGGFTRLGEQIVLWRDATGQAYALEDRCPHRGARLSLGWNLGDRLSCWYHGVEVNHTGAVACVPAELNCVLEGRTRTHAYPLEERNGAIFLWFSKKKVDSESPPPLKLPEQLTDTAFDGILCTAQWDCHYQYAIDNVMDPMHGAYLHARSHSMAGGDKQSKMQIRETEHGLMFEKKGQRDVNFDWVEFGSTNCHWMRLEIPYAKNAGPGGNFGIVGFVTPVDEGRCRVFFWRTRRVSGWQRHTWRFMYKQRLEGLHWDVLEQDRVLLENMATDARSREFLYTHDQGLIQIRRLLEREAKRQIETNASKDDPQATRAVI